MKKLFKSIFPFTFPAFNVYKLIIILSIVGVIISSFSYLYYSNKNKAETIKENEKKIILMEQNLTNQEREFKSALSGMTTYYEQELIQAKNNQKIVYQYKIIEKEKAIELTKKVEKTTNLKDFFEVLKGDVDNENK